MADIRQFFMRKQGRNDENTTEGVNEKFATLSLDLTDNQLANLIDVRIKNASTGKKLIDGVNKNNENFYLGKQLVDYDGDNLDLYDHQSKMVDNRLFLAIDTIAPILGTKRREPIVMPAQNTDESRELSLLTQDYLSWKWNEQKMQLKIADIARFIQIYRICALKYRYVPGTYNDFIVEVKRPECLVIDNKANEDDIGFIADYLKDTVQGLIDRFALDENGKVIKPKKDKLLKSLKVTEDELDTEVVYVEFWTPKFVVWKIKDVILDKAPNPNWLYDNKGKTFNHFSEPQMPYILFATQRLGKGVYGDTTSLEQAIPIQLNLNNRKRQISDNADQASGTWVFNEKYVDRKEASKFTGAPNEHIIYKGDASPQDVAGRLTAKDLGVQTFNDLADDKSEIDNIMGVHSTTRGEIGAQKTLGEAQMLKQSDFGRLDLISQYIDVKCEQLYNAFVQMALVYYDEMKMLKVLGPDKSREFIDFQRDNIEEGIEVIVKGEPLLARAEEMAKYTQMWQSGMIDPLTMFERLNLPNPKELTQRFILYTADPKAYLAQFAMDENSPGMENDPVSLAKRDIRLLEQGDKVPPSPNIDKNHIKEHDDYIKSTKFERLKKDIKMNMAEHVRAELDILKNKVSQFGINNSQPQGQISPLAAPEDAVMPEMGANPEQMPMMPELPPQSY